MGDPRRRRKKYSKPAHPWQKERIEEEKLLSNEYGLKNKQELWRVGSLLRNFKKQAKTLVTSTKKQSEIEKDLLLKRLNSLGLLGKDAKIEEVLSIELKDVLERRLQTIVYRKKLSNSVGQARQFIVHRHIAVGDKVISVPSYMVTVDEEAKVTFRGTSTLAKDDHPERAAAKREVVVEKSKTEEEKPKKKAVKKETKKEEKKPKKVADKKVAKKDDKKAEEKKEEPKVAKKEEKKPEAEAKPAKKKEVPKEEVKAAEDK